MNRKDFVKYLNEHGFKSTMRFNGDHEIFKSDSHANNFVVPKGKKNISMGYLWGFRSMLRASEANKKVGGDK